MQDFSLTHNVEGVSFKTSPLIVALQRHLLVLEESR